MNRNLGLLVLPGGTADEVYAAIVSKLESLGLSDIPLVGFSSDGTSAMVGAVEDRQGYAMISYDELCS